MVLTSPYLWYTKGKSFCKTSSWSGTFKMYTDKAEMKAHTPTTVLQNDGEKERQEDYPTWVASLVIFLFCHHS